MQAQTAAMAQVYLRFWYYFGMVLRERDSP